MRGACPVLEAPNRTYSNADFVELAAVATGRHSSLAAATEAVPCLPDSDTFHAHLHAYTPEAVYDAYQRTLDDVLALARSLGFLRGPVDVSIDRHNEPSYGKHAPWVVGMEKKAGTNWAHAYLTSKRNVDPRVTLDMQRLSPFRDQHAALADLLRSTTRRQEVKRWLLDAGFYNQKDLRLLLATGKAFLVAVGGSTQVPKALLDEAWRTRQRVDLNHYVAWCRHRVGGNDRPEVVLVFHWEPDTSRRKKKSVSDESLFIHARRPPQDGEVLDVAALDRDAHEYRGRWNIETGYRTIEDLRRRTTSHVYTNRLYLTLIAVLLDVAWRLVRHARRRRGRPTLALPHFALDLQPEPTAATA